MDEQLYILGMGLSLSEKVDKAIANFREYESEAVRRDPVNGYFICNSYGKDSCVIVDLAKRSGVKFVAHHNLTTIDPPELIQFGRKHHPETLVRRPEKPMLVKMLEKSSGPPTRLARWCCEIYKESQGANLVKVFGVRAAESARRKANWKLWQPDNNKAWILNPILYWSDADVWQYIRQNKVPYCCLYDEGFKRLGCIGCPMAGLSRVKEFARWPGYEKAWKNAFKKFWEKWHGVPTRTGKARWFDGQRRDGKGLKFHNWEEMWAWWMEETPTPEEEDVCQMGLF